jgi:hypothetical protein
MKMLRAAKAVMYARNRQLGRQKWVDEKGRQRTGVKGFTPTREMPLLVLTIEEAHAILGDDEAKAIVEDLSKMARKCGIKLRLVTQVPTLSQLGNSNVLRSMVASGNVLVLRTGNKSDGGFAFQGALQVDPVSIPREMPDGSTSAGLGFALGSQSRQAPMRTDFVEDPLDHCVTPIARLDRGVRRRSRPGLRPPRPGRGRGHHRGRGDLRDPGPRRPPRVSWSAGPAGSPAPTAPSNSSRPPRTVPMTLTPACRVPLSPPSFSRRGSFRTSPRPSRSCAKTRPRPVWSDDQRTTLYYKEAS